LPSRTRPPLAKPEILRRPEDFQRLRTRGHAARSRSVVVVHSENGRPQFRYAVVAGRKVGKAVRRNRAKRVLREAQRSLLRRLHLGGQDVLLIARSSTADSTSRTLEAQILQLYREQGISSVGDPTPSA
jgi:ribonuclease P protein component